MSKWIKIGKFISFSNIRLLIEINTKKRLNHPIINFFDHKRQYLVRAAIEKLKKHPKQNSYSKLMKKNLKLVVLVLKLTKKIFLVISLFLVK